MEDNKVDKSSLGNKKSKAEIRLFVLSLVVILFLPITIFMVLDWFVHSDTLTIGITGFIQTAIVNGCLGLVATIIAVVFVIKLIQPDTSFKQKVGRCGIILCAVAAFFLVRPLVLDIPYLKRPEAPIWSVWNSIMRGGSGTMAQTLIICARRYDR